MERKTILSVLFLMFILVWSAMAFYSCGSGGDGNSSRSSGTGMVHLFFTDDAADYKELVLTVNRVQLIDSGSNTGCDLLNDLPVTLDVPSLAGLMEFGNSASCPSGSYNRIHIELEQNVALKDGTGASSSCRFTSYLDNGNQVNMLACDPQTGICALDISAAVRRGSLDILPDRNNKLSLDFDLKNFTVEHFGDASACSVTLKVTPLEDSAIVQRSDKESISGRIDDLDTAARSCTLKNGHRPFTMTYGGIAASAQPGLDTLLLAAGENRFTALVLASALDLDAYRVDAAAVSVKAGGIVDDLDKSAKTFTLQYKPPDSTIMVGYDPSNADAPLADGAKVEVYLSGYDETTGIYRCNKVALIKAAKETDD